MKFRVSRFMGVRPTRRFQLHWFRHSVILFGCLMINLMLAPTPIAAESVGVPVLPSQLSNYFEYAVSQLPSHFGTGQFGSVVAQDNTPASNPITDAGATLGRVLFYDRRLSHDNSTSCASCHHQENGFSDPNPQSQGVDGQLTPRHSMGLTNAKFYDNGRFLSDESAPTLEAQVLIPIANPAELGLELSQLSPKLSATSYYADLFTSAFGSATITPDRISKSLSQFVRSMVSYQSKFDQVRQGTESFTASELAGRQIFHGVGRCVFCHTSEAQTAMQVHNTGLDATTVDPGAGDGKFKSASLRNVEVRGAYMHDGRFTSLEEVVEFYNSGVQDHPQLDFRLKDGAQPLRLNLSPTEKNDLVAFLRTLTDWDFLTDERFSDPFQLLCDFDGDSSCGTSDLDRLLSEGPFVTPIVVNANNGGFDLNGDGLVDRGDVDRWLVDAAEANGFLSPYQVGDANLDGAVDTLDFQQWNANRFQVTTDWSRGDFNGDGVVDVSDFHEWNAHKFSTLPSLLVPEPSFSIAVLLLAMLAMHHQHTATLRPCGSR